MFYPESDSLPNFLCFRASPAKKNPEKSLSKEWSGRLIHVIYVLRNIEFLRVCLQRQYLIREDSPALKCS